VRRLDGRYQFLGVADGELDGADHGSVPLENGRQGISVGDVDSGWYNTRQRSDPVHASRDRRNVVPARGKLRRKT